MQRNTTTILYTPECHSYSHITQQTVKVVANSVKIKYKNTYAHRPPPRGLTETC